VGSTCLPAEPDPGTRHESGSVGEHAVARRHATARAAGGNPACWRAHAAPGNAIEPASSARHGFAGAPCGLACLACGGGAREQSAARQRATACTRIGHCTRIGCPAAGCDAESTQDQRQ
jgi:hypothetical protein